MARLKQFKYFTALTLAGSLLAGNANSEPLLVDSFELGDMSATNEDGFNWARNNRTSVVTAEASVYNNKTINNPIPAGHDWEPKHGEHSLRFRYPAGEAMAEQRFKIGKTYPEIWMSFWLRVPTNYAHPKVAGADNQKLFRLWMDAYNGEGSTVGMSFRGDGNGGSYFFAKMTGSGDIGRAPFINGPEDRGRWMHLVVHIKSESLPGLSDGLMGVWRKWEGDPDYTKTHDLENQPIKLSPSVPGFSEGYLMGWANAAYPVDTEFLIDDFALATSPLFSNSSAPNAPSDLAIRLY